MAIMRRCCGERSPLLLSEQNHRSPLAPGRTSVSLGEKNAQTRIQRSARNVRPRRHVNVAFGMGCWFHLPAGYPELVRPVGEDMIRSELCDEAAGVGGYSLGFLPCCKAS